MSFYSVSSPKTIEPSKAENNFQVSPVKSHLGDGDCNVGELVLKSQQGVENYQSQYGSCNDTYADSVTIEGSDINDIGALKNLKNVSGNLKFVGTNLTGITGLDNLTSVGGYLIIEYNSSLTEINAFQNLERIGAGLIIRYNHKINKIYALPNLSTLTQGIEIWGDATERTDKVKVHLMSEFSNLTTTGYLSIAGLNIDSLKSFNNLTSIHQLELSSLKSLKSLDGLQNLTEFNPQNAYINDNCINPVKGQSKNFCIWENNDLTDCSQLKTFYSKYKDKFSFEFTDEKCLSSINAG